MMRIYNRFRWPICSTLCLVTAAAVSRAEEAESTPPELVLVAPGTRIADEPPPGWSHLVVKSVPRLESGDLNSLPSFASSTATLFRTVILAEVRHGRGDGPEFRLARVGLGLCVPSGETDTVVTRESAAGGRTTLSLIERKVLDRAEEELIKARLIARTTQFAVLATPSELLVDGRHEKIFLFYALSVDPGDGRLSVLMWAYTTSSDRRVRVSGLSLLPDRLVYRCGLDVESERLLGALPVNWSFAMRSLPPGTRVATPESIRAWLTDPRRIASEPARFEELVRTTLASTDGLSRARTTSRVR